MDNLPPNIPPMENLKSSSQKKVDQKKIDSSISSHLELLRQLSSSPSPSDNSREQKQIKQNDNKKQMVHNFQRSSSESSIHKSSQDQIYKDQSNDVDQKLKLQSGDDPIQSSINQANKGEKPQKQKFLRYKYCCRKCKHADRDKDKKACVCVVPMNQRRTHLGSEGCQTCGCIGCSKQDYIHRGQDPVYQPSHNDRKNEKQISKQHAQIFEARNGCCKKCMKAFSKSNKSCICQVPDEVRKTKLSDEGCKICGCKGCNPQDKKHTTDNNPKQSSHNQNLEERRRRSRSQSQKRSTRRRQRRSRSNSYEKPKDRQRKKSRSRSPQIIDTYTMNFNNIDRSMIGSMIISQYQLNPALLGFGIPQRTSSYITGKFK